MSVWCSQGFMVLRGTRCAIRGKNPLLCSQTLAAAVFALLVQSAWAAGAMVSNAPPAPLAADTNAVTAPWRNPFWPVGYRPPQDTAALADVMNATVAVAASQSRWPEAYKLLQIQGLSRSQSQSDGRPRYLAVINGRMVETDDRVVVELDGVRYRWRVQTITSKAVELEKVDALVVPAG